MTARPGNSKFVKKLNRMTVLNVIKNYEPISRHQLAEKTGLTPPAITGIVRELLELSFAKEVGLGKSEGGRRPMKLKFNCQAGYVIGLEVTSNEAVLSVADLKNPPETVAVKELSMKDTAEGLAGMTAIIQEVIAENKDKHFLGVGIAFPGLLNVKGGTVRRSINLGGGWDGYPLKAALEQKLKLPVFVENNSNASAMAERWFGGMESKDLVYVNLGEGISAGIILGDRILQGYRGYAGEIGHIVLDEDGPLCNCGNRGCLEAICAVPALMNKVRAEMPLIAGDDPLKAVWNRKGKVSFTDVLSAAQQQEGYAWELFKQMGKKVGRVIADIINLYNPELIYVGGKMAAAPPVFVEAIEGAVKSHAFPEVAAATSIKVSKFGQTAASMGACALALQQLLQSPESPMFDEMLGEEKTV